ncbi:Hypothetical predicted protein [Xyrichtys novacula]|uniref:Uncharacterized protein n=1 Tax=Xyrichtys novacula TaxID=13765 RepID=A0AAV1G167_XYRNO|nr:Hypothetical predicted protein [Xyrichtys novacula]
MAMESQKPLHHELPSQNSNTKDAGERITEDLISSLILKLYRHVSWRDILTIKLQNHNSIVERLYNRPMNDNSFLKVIEIENKEKFLKEVLKDLKNEIGPLKQTLRVAVSNLMAFDDAVLRCLKSKLEKTKKGSGVARFYGALGRPLRKSLHHRIRISSLHFYCMTLHLNTGA